MFSKKRNLNNKGFTIIELLIVIIVIVILSLLVVFAYKGIQAKERNTKRQSNIMAIQAQLEGFFSQNGYYPSLTDMNSASWLKDNMKNLNRSVLTDPSNPTGSEILVNKPVTKSYSYQVTDSNGNSCESDDTTCAKYTLTATYEGKLDGQTTYVKANLD